MRTCEQVEGRAVIDFAYRGFKTKIAPAMDTSMAESDCVYCARYVAVCPVGALTYKPMAGKGRTFEINKKEVICTFCEAGCRFDLNYKGDKDIGISAKEPGTGRPLCLKGRLGLELLYADKPVSPMLKKNGEFVKVSWEEALGLEEFIGRIEHWKKEEGKGR